MAEAWVTLRLRCAYCGFISDCPVRCDEARRVGSAVFIPQTCSACGARGAAPTVRPYRLTADDRQWLKTQKIAQEDED